MADEFGIGCKSDWLDSAALDAGKSRSRDPSRVVSRSGKDCIGSKSIKGG